MSGLPTRDQIYDVMVGHSPLAGRNTSVVWEGPVLRTGPGPIGPCLRCQDRWVDKHVTAQCFALCESCWKALGTPARRLPFYRVVWERLAVQRLSDWARWLDIASAVELGQ